MTHAWHHKGSRLLPMVITVLVFTMPKADLPLGAVPSAATVQLPQSKVREASAPAVEPLTRLPDQADALATMLSGVETELRATETPPSAWPALGHLQQRLYRRLGRNPALATDVRQRLKPELRRAYDLHIAARRALQAMVPAGRPPLQLIPAWRIRKPDPADQLLAHYSKAAASTGIAWTVLAAVNLIETGLGRLDGISVANAQGPMQFLPSTWAERGIGRGDIRDPHDVIQAAARYLVRRGGLQNIRQGLWGYNNSHSYGTAVLNYAALLREHPTAFRGLYHWQIHLRTTSGDVWLPVGTHLNRPMDVGTFVRLHPWSRSDAGI